MVERYFLNCLRYVLKASPYLKYVLPFSGPLIVKLVLIAPCEDNGGEIACKDGFENQVHNHELLSICKALLLGNLMFSIELFIRLCKSFLRADISLSFSCKKDVVSITEEMDQNAQDERSPGGKLS